ncbi:hypothetical protein ACQPZZ_21850 [Microbispora sp. CA-135349]|uniref:hypothetical protein n=1 Tax=Microbispora sp. CA-135349 TaxID=3239953 RepID=UPI003D8E0BD5
MLSQAAVDWQRHTLERLLGDDPALGTPTAAASCATSSTQGTLHDDRRGAGKPGRASARAVVADRQRRGSSVFRPLAPASRAETALRMVDDDLGPGLCDLID